MYLNKQKKPNGDIYLSIREKYHVPKVGARERTIESIGYLSELQKTIDDPIDFYSGNQYAQSFEAVESVACSSHDDFYSCYRSCRINLKRTGRRQQ